MADRTSSIIVLIYTVLGSQPLLMGGIGPGPIPDDATFPYISVREMVSVPEVTHDGPSNLTVTAFKVTCSHKDYDKAANSRTAVYNILKNYSGTPTGSLVIQGTYPLGGGREYDPKREIHELFSRFKVWTEE